MSDVEVYRDRLATAFLRTIHEQSVTIVDGAPTAVMNVAAICDALAIAAAAFLEPAPVCRTPKGMREISETLGRDVLRRMKDMRAIYEETGRRAFDAALVNPH